MTPLELKIWRTSLGMTQREFGDYLEPNRDPSLISQYETGDRPIPAWLDNFKKLKELEAK